MWQRRFAFFDQYGRPDGSPQARAAYRAMSFGERLRLNSNILAFIFGPFYFFAKRMWRKGFTLLIAELAAVALKLLSVPDAIVRPVGFAVSAMALLTANYAYYLHVRRGSTSWNPFEGFGTRDSTG